MAGFSWTVSAPAKVILFGEHAVLYGYPAIAVSIGLYCHFGVTVSEEPSRNSRINIAFRDFSESVVSLPDPIELAAQPMPTEQALKRAQETASLNNFDDPKVTLCTCVCTYLLLRCLEVARPKLVSDMPLFSSRLNVHIDVRSEIPIGSGLGSSAAFCTAATTTFLLLAGYFSTDNRIILTNAEKALVQSLANEAESIIHGRASGLDTTMAVYGGGICFQRLGTEVTIRDLPNISRIIPNMLIVDSGVSRSTAKAVAVVGDRCSQDPLALRSLADIGTIVSETLASLHCSTTEASEKIAQLVRRNQKILQQLGVSHQTIDHIISMADQMGLNGKLTGAGLGGCVFAIPRHCCQETTDDKLFIAAEQFRQMFWSQVVHTSVGGVTLTCRRSSAPVNELQ